MSPTPSKFVTAINTRGEEQRIPAAWLDHEELGKPFRLAPAVTEQTEDGDAVVIDPTVPTSAWHVPDLVAYAKQHDIDLDGATRKGEILTALGVKA